MEKGVISLGEINPQDIENRGGKATNLAQLHQSGFNVPPGVSISSKYYVKMIEQIPEARDMLKRLDTTSDFEDVLEIAAALQILVKLYRMPSDLKGEVESEIKKLKHGLGFAVRSSASVEDRADISFAGQAESSLCVNGIDAVIEATKRVWLSALSPTVAIYLKTKGIPMSSVRMGVVVQEMIPAEIAGVMFTANVVENNRAQMLIESTWGLGESLVSGKVVPDSFILEKKSKKIVSKALGTKESIFQYSKTETVKETTPLLMRERFTLSDVKLAEIAQIGIEIEEQMGSPQDIEWCMRGEEIVILQSRPITTLR
ncbi:MAG: PEP/pyruvate-binding domain-containing protein [Candidatus Thorarchaeota archaeon]|nr:PEP/pyruvate-binding domain-containing protein [Candidatus Thorarchaeota archaeon]